MRLINVETMQLHYLPNADIVEIEYATLSHTWGRYETTYQKWHDAQARESDDTKKIRDACQVVKESLGLQWLWADTCCINKADEDEVNEAVNSMFSWYQSSTICLAYLSDVPTANTDNNELLSSQVRNSRWFTRGWTLPELLAPPQLIFYAADWTVLGQRDDSLAELISEITGIDQAYISGRRSVQQASFSKRMSWLSGRRTTLVEDAAYA
ncbi:heterokaryon incompatibility protein-domain-containing protein [Fusarium tricinctum]|uniref:Heterokaryon incompatibility protein-domain-containing protein n=1 Tax=Fusarium tricinctum TaxID=61284 RepID=A0A8K0WCE9_9HYPO|nr:heterokaryon incompatibility protein-domain-containing protein [Fusarium tricinctum]